MKQMVVRLLNRAGLCRMRHPDGSPVVAGAINGTQLHSIFHYYNLSRKWWQVMYAKVPFNNNCLIYIYYWAYYIYAAGK